MAKLTGVKTLDMVGGEITKVEYGGAVYEKVEGDAQAGDLLYCTKSIHDTLAGSFYEVIKGNFDESGFFDEAEDECDVSRTHHKAFRKVSAPTIESVDAKVDALTERVDALEEAEVTSSLKKGDRAKLLSTKGALAGFTAVEEVTVLIIGGHRVQVEGVSHGIIGFTDANNLEKLGAGYTLVDRKAQPGDVVIIPKGGGSPFFREGEAYKVSDHGEQDNPTAFGTDGDFYVIYNERYNRDEGNVKVYAPAKPKTVKRKARVGERILITDATQTGGKYKNGDILTVRETEVFKRCGDVGTVRVEERSQAIYMSEYEVIVEKDEESTSKYRKVTGRKPREGDFVKFDDAPYYFLTADKYYEIIEIDCGDPVITDDDGDEYDTYGDDFEVYELVSGEAPVKPYKPVEGDIVVITAITNASRNAVGDIGKVGEIDLDTEDARVHVPGKDDSSRGNWTLFGEMRPATDEEKAKYEAALKDAEMASKFAKLGISEARKPGEFKKGDIVRGHRHDDESRKFIGEVEDVTSNMIGVREYSRYYHAANKGDCELIAPVESRVDR